MSDQDKSREELIHELAVLRNRVRELEQDESALPNTKRALKETLITQRAILDNIPDMAWLKDKQGRFLEVNKPFERASGIRRERLVGKTDFDFWPESLAQRYRSDDEEVMRLGEQKRVEETLVHSKGEPVWIETIKSPILDDAKQVIGTTGISRDVTERKLTKERLEAALAESNRLLAEAAQYVKNLLPEPVKDGEICVDWCFVPSAALGGDSFGYHWLDSDHFAIYLVDVCGHGVSAALLSVTILNVLRSRTLKNVDFRKPDQILSALNTTFPMEQQNGMFFTIWYGVYNKSSRELAYSCGGHPPALLLAGRTDGTARITQLHTPNLFIGGMPDISFEMEVIELTEPCGLYVFSDGVFEIPGQDGSIWTFNGFADFLAQAYSAKTPIGPRLLRHVQEMSGAETMEDDFSILEIDFCG